MLFVVTKLWIATPALPPLVATETRVRKDENISYSRLPATLHLYVCHSPYF